MNANDSDPADLLDWTMTTAPTAEEVVEAPPPLTRASRTPLRLYHPHQFSRWMWLTLGGLTTLVILGLMVFALGNNHRVAAEVRHIFLAEEEAALSGNINILTRLTAHGYADWLSTRLALAEQYVAAPAPAPFFTPSPQAGDIISLTTFASDIMQADILRTYTGPAGEATHFLTTQFYQYQDGWKRTPTPPYFSGELRQFEGRRLTIIHFDRDADLINTLGPYLDSLLESACVEWDCADNFNLALQFVVDTPAFDRYPTTEPAPLILKMLAYTNTIWLEAFPLNLPAPHIIGTPADEASRLAFQQVLGQQVLLYAAQRFISEADGPTRNALAYALVMRLAVRLKLAASSTLNSARLTLATDLEALWDMGATPIWEQRSQRQMALRSALTVLNVLLQDQPLTVEQALFQQLRHRNSARGWLTDGLGMEYADVQATLALAGQRPLSALLPPEAEPTLALQCVSGPQLYFEAVNQTLPFVAGPFFDAQISGWPWQVTGDQVWSPDGNYLLLTVSGQPAVLNLAALSLTWVNMSGNNPALRPRGWLSATTVASLSESELHFLDVTQPERSFPAFGAVIDYVLAPDRRRAAVVWDQPDGQGNGQMMVMSATGDGLLNVDFGASPVWTMDASALLYIQHERYRAGDIWQSRSLIKRADIVNGLRYIVQEGDSMWSIVARYNTTFADIWAINRMQTNVITPGQDLIIPIRDSQAQVVVMRSIFSSDDPSLLPGTNFIYLTGSPDGATLAVVLESPTDEPYQLLLMNADGSLTGELSTTLVDTGIGNPQRLIRTNPNSSLPRLAVNGTTQLSLPPRFSADGQFLAALAEHAGAPALNLYDINSGQWTRIAENVSSFAWSATGHRLALTTEYGTLIMDDPSRSTVSTIVTREVCRGAWWRP